MNYYTVALDGPSGAGKSTSAKALAQRLNLAYLDTGAMYRALAVAFLDDGLNPSSQATVERHLDDYTIEVLFTEEGQRCFVNGRDLSERLYSSEAGMGASDISKHPIVRDYLVDKQREIAERTSFVLDGRDIGTVVLPDAKVKFFLTASAETRAERRLHDLLAKGEDISFEQVLADIQRRDKQDSERAASPLRQAEDALLIDSTDLGFDEVIDLMIRTIQEKVPLNAE